MAIYNQEILTVNFIIYIVKLLLLLLIYKKLLKTKICICGGLFYNKKKSSTSFWSNELVYSIFGVIMSITPFQSGFWSGVGDDFTTKWSLE